MKRAGNGVAPNAYLCFQRGALLDGHPVIVRRQPRLALLVHHQHELYHFLPARGNAESVLLKLQALANSRRGWGKPEAE